MSSFIEKVEAGLRRGRDLPEDPPMSEASSSGPARTACRDCKHRVLGESALAGRMPLNMWHQNYCGVTPCKKVFDAVDGVMVPISDPPYAYCREVNNGNCPKFEPRKS